MRDRTGLCLLLTVLLIVSMLAVGPALGTSPQASVLSADPAKSKQSFQNPSGPALLEQQVIGSPEISVGTTVSKFNPGTEAQLRLALTNRGQILRAGPAQYEERVTTARALNLEVKDGETPFDVQTGTVAVGNVPTGAVQSPPIDITIPEDIEPGKYTLPVEYEYAYTRVVNYNSKNVEYVDWTTRETAEVTIHVRHQAQFEIVDRETSAQIGDTSDIQITLENVGTRPATASSVSAASRSDELTFGTGSDSSTAYVGNSWEPNERRTVNYSVALANDATNRAYTLDLHIDYTDTDGIAQTSQTLNVGVPTVQSQEFTVRNIQSSLRASTEGRLTATIVNQGPQAISAPVASLQSNNENIDINNPEYALPDLAAGESTQVNYSIDVSSAAKASVQQFTITVAYNNQNGDRRNSEPIQANARIAPQRDRFVVTPVNQTAVAGHQTTLELRVTNNGDEPLKNIEGKSFLNNPLSSSDDEVFIDQLHPGETTTVSIALSVNSGALEKTYPFSIDFQYETPDGDTQVSQTYNVPLQVRQVTQEGGLPLPLIGGFLLLLIGAILIWYRRRE